jgi:hypothetical protein
VVRRLCKLKALPGMGSTVYIGVGPPVSRNLGTVTVSTEGCPGPCNLGRDGTVRFPCFCQLCTLQKLKETVDGCGPRGKLEISPLFLMQSICSTGWPSSPLRRPHLSLPCQLLRASGTWAAGAPTAGWRADLFIYFFIRQDGMLPGGYGPLEKQVKFRERKNNPEVMASSPIE